MYVGCTGGWHFLFFFCCSPFVVHAKPAPAPAHARSPCTSPTRSVCGDYGFFMPHDFILSKGLRSRVTAHSSVLEAYRQDSIPVAAISDLHPPPPKTTILYHPSRPHAILNPVKCTQSMNDRPFECSIHSIQPTPASATQSVYKLTIRPPISAMWYIGYRKLY